MNNKPSELATKNGILRLHLNPTFGTKPLRQIGKQEVETYKAKKLKEGLSPKTIQNHLACLSKILRTAVEWGYLGAAPAIKPMKLVCPEFDFLTFEEADRLVAASHGMYRLMILVILHTGLRIGELRALRWEDVDLVTGRLVVRRSVYRADQIGSPKSGKPREVPLNSLVLQALKSYRHLRGQLVFCREDGRILGETATYEPLAFICKRAGLRTIGWHVLRHMFASHLVMRGQPMKAVQELLGHGTIAMTERYSHLSPDVRRSAVEALTMRPLSRPGDGPTTGDATQGVGMVVK